MDTTLVVVCKRPKLGQGKQRLATDIGHKGALAVAQGLWCCALEDARRWPGRKVLAVSHWEDMAWADRETGDGFTVRYQPQGNLGERLQALDLALREQGHQKILLMGTDAPLLTEAHYFEARSLLEHQDIALHPAEDGGLVLMGASRPWPELAQLPWSSESLGKTLESLCKTEGLAVGLGAGSFDIDNKADLIRLPAALERDTRPARKRLLQLLRQLLPHIDQ